MNNNYPRNDQDVARDDDIRISRRAALAGAAGVVGVAAAAVLAILLRNGDDDDPDDSGVVATTSPIPTPSPTVPLPPTETQLPPAATATPDPTMAATETPTITPEPTATEATPTATAEPSPTATSTTVPPTEVPAPMPGWTMLTPDGDIPSARRDHSLVVDQAAGRVYLYGGRAGSAPLADLWSYEIASNQWRALTPEGAAPAARFGHNAIFDESQQFIVIFGGQAGSTFFSDVWIYDPVTNVWAQANPDEQDNTPQPRYGAASSIQVGGSGLYVSHGFTDNGRFDDTWLFNFQTGSWTDVSPDSGARPEPRCLVRMATDPPRERLLLFGGQSNTSAFLGDLWAFDTSDNSWSQIETNNPPPRNLYSLVHQPESGNLILFGGATADGMRGDIWTLDVETDEWSVEIIDPGVSLLVPPRDSHDAVWVDTIQAMLMFGGRGESGMLNDLWTYVP